MKKKFFCFNRKVVESGRKLNFGKHTIDIFKTAYFLELSKVFSYYKLKLFLVVKVAPIDK